MYKIILLLLISFSFTFGQTTDNNKDFTVSDMYPYGRYNPSAPEQVLDFDPMIGICECKSVRRNPDGTWQDTLSMIWKFKYILNGTAVQDETWIEDGTAATSIRQFHPDSLYWMVSFYSSRGIGNNVSLWRGNKTSNDIVLSMPQKAPNGMDGTSQLTFYDISDNGFKWKGEWLNLEKTITYPFWNIECKKRK